VSVFKVLALSTFRAATMSQTGVFEHVHHIYKERMSIRNDYVLNALQTSKMINGSSRA
jgi:hypothetical protein